MASRPQPGPYPESYVNSDQGSREWHDYTKPTEIVSVEEPKLDIVFVHGLGQRWQQTWEGANGTSWLESLLPTELPPVRIIVSGFNALTRIDGGLSSFSDGCDKFMEDLAKIRDDKHRAIIFVGHSLGGLILQQALAGLPDCALRASIKGMLFFGTPQFEEDHAAWKEFRIQMGRMVDGNTAPEEMKSATLQKLGQINIGFQKWLGMQLFSRHVYRYYEGLPVYRIGMIVQQDACKVVNPEDSTISSDHLGMAKFDDPSDPNYQIVVKRLKHMYSYKDTSASSSIATRNFSAHMMSFDTQMSAFSATAPVRTGTNDSQISCPDAREEILASGNVEVKLALALEDQGSYKEAEQAYRDAIDNLTDLRGETDRFTLYCMDKLASLLRDRSRYDEAAALAKKVLVARIEQLGLESSTTLSSAGNLALIMRYQNKQQAAFSMLRNALEANDTPPLSSITRTRIASVLAKIYRDHGAYDAAELLSRDVARACSLWLGDEHPFTLNRQSDLSVAYSTCEGKNRYLVAEDLARQTLDGLERNLGRDHPNALRTSKRLGNYLRFEGDCEHAAKRLEMTYLRMKEQLGFHHPGTLSALTSFAAASAAQGYVEEARRNFNDALKDQVELLGCDHPNTLWTIQALEHLDKMDPKTGGEQASSSLGASDTEWFLTPSRIQHKVSLEPVPVFWDSIHSADRALIDAIGSNNENMVKDVLSEVTDQDTLGRGLRVAAYSGRERIVRTLLEHGAPVNSSGGYYGTALQAASSSGHVATVEFLLEMNADANVQGGLLNTPLRAAVFEGWRGIAQTLLDNGADVNVHGESSSILQVAVGRHDTEMVRMILERGAMANATDHLFGSALQEASFHGDEEIVSLLIQYGADPNLAGGLYGSAMQAALRASQRGTVKLLMEAGADASSYNMLNAILESGMDLGEVSFGRHTSDLFVMEPKFSAKADVHSLRFSMRTRTLRSKGSQHEQQERQQHEESKGSTTAEVTRRAEYTQRSRSPIRPRTPKEGKVKQGRDSSKVRGKGFSRHLKILGR